MKLLLPITILLLSISAYSQNTGDKLSHWLPPVHLNLYEEIQKIENLGTETSDSDSSDEVYEQNMKAIDKLNKRSWKSTKRQKYVTKEFAEQLLKKINLDPVAGPKGYPIYDPENRYGFCFGRATWVWLQALKAGVDKQSIKKIFLVGPMKNGGTEWQFHVVTALRTSKGFFSDTWVVVDPNFKKILTVEEFFTHYNRSSTDYKLRLFVTEPQRLGPSSTIKFGPAHYTGTGDENYNRYFQHMLENFSKNIKYEQTKSCEYLF